MSPRCKYADILDQQPKCYKPPFDELMAIGHVRAKRLMDFLEDEKEELALKELDEMRGVLDRVEAKIKEYMSEEAEHSRRIRASLRAEEKAAWDREAEK